MSATRTKIMESFQRQGNIADLTGKHWSQTVAASVVGMANGIGLSLLASYLHADHALFNLLCFPLIGLSALLFTHRSCACIDPRVLTLSRLSHLCKFIFTEHLSDFTGKRISALVNIVPGKLGESVLWSSKSHFSRIAVNPPITQYAIARLASSANGFLKSHGFYITAADGKYCVWVDRNYPDADIVVAGMIAAFYSSALVEGSSHQVSDEHMMTIFNDAYVHFNTCIQAIIEGLRKADWHVTFDIIPGSMLVDIVE